MGIERGRYQVLQKYTCQYVDPQSREQRIEAVQLDRQQHRVEGKSVARPRGGFHKFGSQPAERAQVSETTLVIFYRGSKRKPAPWMMKGTITRLTI